VLKILLILGQKCQKKLLKFLLTDKFESWIKHNEKSRFNIIRKFLMQFQVKEKHIELFKKVMEKYLKDKDYKLQIIEL